MLSSSRLPWKTLEEVHDLEGFSESDGREISRLWIEPKHGRAKARCVEEGADLGDAGRCQVHDRVLVTTAIENELDALLPQPLAQPHFVTVRARGVLATICELRAEKQGSRSEKTLGLLSETPARVEPVTNDEALVEEGYPFGLPRP